jgi:hypothetical protein
MLRSAIFAVMALLLAVPASAAPPVLSDPGRCAQFYPNANCQNYGPGNPFRSYGRAHRRWHGRHHHRHWHG